MSRGMGWNSAHVREREAFVKQVREQSLEQEREMEVKQGYRQGRIKRRWGGDKNWANQEG